MKACPTCEARTPDGLPCTKCANEVIEALGRVPWLWQRLAETVRRLDKLAETSDRHGGSIYPPLPFRPDPAELRDQLRTQLVGWVRITIEDLNADIPANHVPEMCMHLQAWTNAMRRHEAFADYYTETTAIPNQITAAINAHAPKVKLGNCPDCEAGTVVADLPRVGVPFVRCDTCTAEWDAWHWETLAKALA